MKKHFYLSTLLFLAVTLKSCDWFEDVSTKDVTFATEISTELHASQENSNIILEELVLDPLSDEDFAQYKEDIKELEITAIGFIINQVNSSSESLRFTGKLEYSEGSGSKILLANLHDVDLTSLAALGEEQSFDVSTEQISNLVRIFKNQNSVTLYLSGELSEIPADFDMEVIAHINATAEVGI